MQFLVLVLVLKPKLGVALKYFRDHIYSPLSAASHRHLSSMDWHVLFVPHVGITMAKTRYFPPLGLPYGMPFPTP